MKRSIRRLAWFEAVLGVVVLACGIAAPFVPLIAVGVALTGAGLWNLLRTSVHGLLVDGVTIILAGVFNCVAWLWMEHARATSVGNWIVTGVLQIVWGVRRLALYPTARAAPNDSQAIARLESIVRELSKRNAKDDPTVVEFRTGRWPGRRDRIGLYDLGSVALLEHTAVRLEKRTDIWIEARGTTFGGALKVAIQMSDLHLTGRMSAAHLERFERWKLGLSLPRPVAA